MKTMMYCAGCEAETERIGFKCLECESTYCSQCVGKAKDYGEGVKEFRCPECGNTLFFHLPLPVNRLEKLASTKSAKTSFHPNKRASRPGVKPGSEGDDSKMTWMQTFSGKAYVIANPTLDQICLEDIARALSHQCRFAGHCLKYYSVAEHSVNVCNRTQELLEVGEITEGERQVLAMALLHDASEAYLLDIPRPLKIEPSMEFYRNMHLKTMELILDKFELPKSDETLILRRADNEMLATEKEQIMAKPPRDWVPLPDPLPITLKCWNSEKAYTVFMEQAKALGISDGSTKY